MEQKTIFDVSKSDGAYEILMKAATTLRGDDFQEIEHMHISPVEPRELEFIATVSISTLSKEFFDIFNGVNIERNIVSKDGQRLKKSSVIDAIKEYGGSNFHIGTSKYRGPGDFFSYNISRKRRNRFSTTDSSFYTQGENLDDSDIKNLKELCTILGITSYATKEGFKIKPRAIFADLSPQRQFKGYEWAYRQENGRLKSRGNNGEVSLHTSSKAGADGSFFIDSVKLTKHGHHLYLDEKKIDQYWEYMKEKFSVPHYEQWKIDHATYRPTIKVSHKQVQ